MSSRREKLLQAIATEPADIIADRFEVLHTALRDLTASVPGASSKACAVLSDPDWSPLMPSLPDTVPVDLPAILAPITAPAADSASPRADAAPSPPTATAAGACPWLPCLSAQCAEFGPVDGCERMLTADQHAMCGDAR